MRGARARGPQGVAGVITQLWAARATGRITHVLVRASTGLRRGPERIVPAELIAGVRAGELALKVGPDRVRELPIYRPDPAIEADVHLALDATLADPRARRAVKVRVEDGQVTLAGVVDTVEQVTFAERAAAAVPGVRGVVEDLVAEETLAAEVEARIAPLVAQALNGYGSVKVLSEHGIVYLEGTVRRAQARAEIERAALGAAGARVVVNNLQVEGEAPDRGPGTGPLVRNR
jgi:osmotically-inducible protein OsmY